ncbi:hypothetical protein [Streptosporangium sp. KLBMP 9127]|nr:hypothetical protein [Streptosporangium sp. KLBMP 9127]
MTPGQKTHGNDALTGRSVPELTGEQTDIAVPELTVEQHDIALGVVRRLLAARGLHTHHVNHVGLTLLAGRPPWGSGALRHYAPELLVFAPLGWRVATVSVGASSGSYFVSVPAAGPEPYIVPADLPEQVAELIPGYQEGTADHLGTPHY